MPSFRSASPAQRLLRPALSLLGAALVLAPTLGSANDFCPDVWHGGKFGPLNFKPAFLHIDEFNHPNGNKYDGLVFSSFFNSIKNPDGNGVVDFFERDLVARIQGISYRYPAWFNKDRDVEILTDLTNASPVLPSGPGQQVWPNEVTRVPDGILPFEAVVSPQGFHPAYSPGRLSIINLDDPNKQEYIVDQSLQDPTNGAACVFPDNPNYNPEMRPRFYHEVVWFDMDGDGLKDIVSVRSGFRVRGAFCFSADIALEMHDFEGDGVPEIIGTRFFPGNFGGPGEHIEIYGAPIGDDWTDVDPATNPPRTAIISTGQGRPFGIQIVDLNLDGKVDVLATNHQGDGCFSVTNDAIPGKVYALEQPASGDIFNDPWVTHILKDNIRPNPTYPTPTSGPGRLAPGAAQKFWPSPYHEALFRPWILVGGDEASKVWLLKPQSESTTDWNYDSAVIFDINDYYGANTTQTLTAPPPDVGNSISTVGSLTWHYDRDWAWGSWAEIYLPVFEGRDIHRISFRPGSAATKVTCPPDGALACPAP